MSGKEEVIRHTENYVRRELRGEKSGHDWHHIQRVVTMTEKLIAAEGGNRFIAVMAALLHDIADHKLNRGNEEVGLQKVNGWLQKFKAISPAERKSIIGIIRNVSFKGAGVEERMQSLEGKIVQDADRLDAIGAIGIARTFTYGGSKGREIYDPDAEVMMHRSFEDYKKSSGPTLNHFYEKLLLLKDRMNTETASGMAEERHAFMEAFLDRFYKEVKAEV